MGNRMKCATTSNTSVAKGSADNYQKGALPPPPPTGAVGGGGAWHLSARMVAQKSQGSTGELFKTHKIQARQKNYVQIHISAGETNGASWATATRIKQLEGGQKSGAFSYLTRLPLTHRFFSCDA